METMATKRKKRPRDPLQLAKLIGDIATGQTDDDPCEDREAIIGQPGGLKGGKARAKKLSPEQRSDIARIAATARWKKR